MIRRLLVILPYAPDERPAHDAVIAAASTLAPTLDVLQLAPEAAAAQPRALGDATRWWTVVHPAATADASPDTVAALVASALRDPQLGVDGPALVVLPTTPQAEPAAAQLACILNGAALGRCTQLALESDSISGTRAAFGGRLRIQVRSTERLSFATWRPQEAGFPALRSIPASLVRTVSVQHEATPVDVEPLPSADRQARLEGAPLVVSGGRGMGAEGFELLTRLAEHIGAALGGSLPAVDAGWVSVARQVGQSGKFVAPQVYVAVAISGTPQHLAGIAEGTRIVAVNSDPDAPIFAVADVGVVADWREVLPALLERLAAAARHSGTVERANTQSSQEHS